MTSRSLLALCLAGAALIAACGDSKPANDPSSTTTVTPPSTTSVTPAKSASDIGAAAPTTPATPATPAAAGSAAPASSAK